jgi:hypothetical protein
MLIWSGPTSRSTGRAGGAGGPISRTPSPSFATAAGPLPALFTPYLCTALARVRKRRTRAPYTRK